MRGPHWLFESSSLGHVDGDFFGTSHLFLGFVEFIWHLFSGCSSVQPFPFAGSGFSHLSGCSGTPICWARSSELSTLPPAYFDPLSPLRPSFWRSIVSRRVRAGVDH